MVQGGVNLVLVGVVVVVGRRTEQVRGLDALRQALHLQCRGTSLIRNSNPP